MSKIIKSARIGRLTSKNTLLRWKDRMIMTRYGAMMEIMVEKVCKTAKSPRISRLTHKNGVPKRGFSSG